MNERHRWMIATTLLMLAAFCLAGCSGGGESEEGTPGAAVESFYRYLSEGSYEDAQAMYSAEAREIVADPEMFRSWAEQATKNNSIDKVVILDSTIAEDQVHASVDFELSFGGGSSEAYSVQLVDEAGEWKIGLVVPK